jgi:MFS family permease
MVAGAPRFVILALDVPLLLALGVWVFGGVGQGFLNPIIWAVIFERIPRDLLGRVQSLITALAWVGIPLGPPIAGAVVVVVGLSPVLVAFGLVFLVVTTLPGLQREWVEMNRSP